MSRNTEAAESFTLTRSEMERMMLKLISAAAVASMIAGSAYAQTTGPTSPTPPPNTQVTPAPGTGSGSAPLGPPANEAARPVPGQPSVPGTTTNPTARPDPNGAKDKLDTPSAGGGK
jgi:hypothetical protein